MEDSNRFQESKELDLFFYQLQKMGCPRVRTSNAGFKVVNPPSFQYVREKYMPTNNIIYIELTTSLNDAQVLALIILMILWSPEVTGFVEARI